MRAIRIAPATNLTNVLQGFDDRSQLLGRVRVTYDTPVLLLHGGICSCS